MGQVEKGGGEPGGQWGGRKVGKLLIQEHHSDPSGLHVGLF